jgi:hypothetical protein
MVAALNLLYFGQSQTRLQLTEQINVESVQWAALICGLCNRKFKNEATLAKHVDASDLHKACASVHLDGSRRSTFDYVTL